MTDVLDMLKQADPVDARRLRAEPPPEEVLEAILASEPGRRDAVLRHRWPPPRRSRIALAVAGAVLVGGIAVLVAGGDGRTVDAAAAAALREVADVARAQPPTLPPGDPRFLYFRVDSAGFLPLAGEPPFQRGIDSEDDVAFVVRVQNRQEVWVGEEGGRVRDTAGVPRFPTTRDRQAWVAAGRPRLPRAGTFEADLDGIERLRIPADPDALLEHLRRRAADGGHGPAYIFETLIADYLREWGVTPAQRAALYEVAARLPGIKLLGRRADPRGRAGIAFAVVAEDRAERVTFTIDPDTAELLAITTVTLPGSPIPEGTTSGQVFSSPALVEAVGERPRG